MVVPRLYQGCIKVVSSLCQACTMVVPRLYPRYSNLGQSDQRMTFAPPVHVLALD